MSFGPFTRFHATVLNLHRHISHSTRSIPAICSGCGAKGHDLDSESPGHYSQARLEKWRRLPQNQCTTGSAQEAQSAISKANVKSSLICDRCHGLVHHANGVPASDLDLGDLQKMLFEHPSNRHHLYLIVDAADFPLSLVNLTRKTFLIPPLRSRNRRAKLTLHNHAKAISLSFVISRSDLLAPRKEQVDQLMPDLIEILRDALGVSTANVRLGNIYCVSAKRHWWTQKLRDDICDRKEVAWIIGKSNVGKSQLTQAIFPNLQMLATRKDCGRGSFQVSKAGWQMGSSEKSSLPSAHLSLFGKEDGMQASTERKEDTNDSIISWPPTFPTISSLPGTTAQPIAMKFPNGLGEIIDVPGLSRRTLADYARSEQRESLYMRERPKAKRSIIHPGQCMLINDLVHIIPQNIAGDLLAYSFLPMRVRIASAQALQEEEPPDLSACSVGNDGPTKIAPAGTFCLKHDVTRRHLGSLGSALGKSALGTLPFSVYAIDVMIEGCGWIEFTVQVRKRAMEEMRAMSSQDPEQSWMPSLRISSPGGGLIGVRKPLNLWPTLRDSDNRKR